MGSRGYIGKSQGEVQEGGKVHFFGGSGGGIGDELDLVVPHVSIAGGGFAAQVSHDTGNDQIGDGFSSE